MSSPSEADVVENRRSVRALPVRALLSAAVPFGFVFGLHYYIGRRLITDAGLSGLPAVLAWCVLVLCLASVPLGVVFARSGDRRWAVLVAWISHLWIGAFALFLVVLPVLDIARWVSAWIQGAPVLLPSTQAGAALLIVGSGMVLGFMTARGRAKVERVSVPIPNLPEAFEGFRIVQVSDIHIGQTLGRDFLQRLVEEVHALKPDAVAITGDLIDGHVDALAGEVAPLQQLRAPDGVYFVTGNHEYYYDGFAWEEAVRRMGITVLHNSHRVVMRGKGALVIAGVPDHDGAHFGAPTRMDETFAGAPVHAPRLLLAHQPRSVRFTQAHDVALQLSGHTHGGQFFPWMFFVKLQQPVVSGLHRLGSGWVYTSRGTGYWGPPLRLGAPPEITEITLTRAEA